MLYRLLAFKSYALSKLSDGVLGAVATTISATLFLGLRFRRKLIEQNIRNALGDQISPQQVTKIGLSSVKSLVLTVLELLEGRNRNIAKNVEIKNPEFIHEALKPGNGCYIMATHLGNWEAMAGKVCQTFTPAYVPVKAVGGKQVNRFLSEIRSGYGLYTKERLRKGDSFEIIKTTLAKGEIVGFMQDQSRPGSPKMNFFGKPAKTNVSMAAIWRKAPAPVVPVIVRRKSPRNHEIEFLPPVNMVRTDDENNDIMQNSMTMNSVVERIILANPEQYLWLHDRWKS